MSLNLITTMLHRVPRSRLHSILIAFAVLVCDARPTSALPIVIPDATPSPAATKAKPPRPKETPKPKPTAPKPAAPSAPSVSGGDQVYTGSVGPYSTAFTLRIGANGAVAGSYTLAVNKGLVMQLTGRNTPGHLQLTETTHGNVTASIQLELQKNGNEIRWEGTMVNTPPDNRVFHVSIARPR